MQIHIYMNHNSSSATIWVLNVNKGAPKGHSPKYSSPQIKINKHSAVVV